MTRTMPPTDSASKPRMREWTGKASRDAGLMGIKPQLEEEVGSRVSPSVAPKSQGCHVKHVGAKDQPSAQGPSGAGWGCLQLPSPAGLSLDSRALRRVGERRAEALTQHHRLPLQGWMQVTASASLAFPEGEAKGLPGVPRAGRSRSLFAGSCLVGRKP